MPLNDQVTQLRIRVDDVAELDEARGVAQSSGLTTQEASAESDDLSADIEPITMLLVGGGVLAAARFVTGWVDKLRGGVVIDQREDAEDDLHRDRDLPWGMFLIYPKDGGEVKIETKDEPKDAIERLLGEIISGAYKSVGELAKIAQDAVSDTSKVSTTGPADQAGDAQA